MADGNPGRHVGPGSTDALEQELAAADARFETLFQASSDGTLLLQLDGTVTAANPAAESLLKQPAEDIVGQSLDVNPDSDAPVEIDLETESREKITVEMSCHRVVRHGQPVYLAILRDISEAMAAERKAAKSLRQRDRFLSLLSHELRTPLSAIINATGVLHRTSDSGVVEQARDVIERESRQLRRLVDELLDVSRLKVGRIELKEEPADLSRIAAAAAEDVRPLMREMGVRFQVDLPAYPVPVNVDPARVRQVLIHLLTNAVRYSRAEGEVQLTLWRESDDAVVRVSDDGVGIPAEHLERIFEPFEKATYLSNASSGLGVGLAVVKQLVDLHRGTVRAHSAGCGQGSEFQVRLPAIPAPATSRQDAAAEPPAQAAAWNLLIVEDNDDARDTLRMLLELEGHQVETARDGNEGLEMIEQLRPDIALVDIGLPGLDGYELARRTRDQMGQRIYLIALTGFGQVRDRHRALAAGFDMHLTKPLDLSVFAKILARVRAGRRPANSSATAVLANRPPAV